MYVSIALYVSDFPVLMLCASELSALQAWDPPAGRLTRLLAV